MKVSISQCIIMSLRHVTMHYCLTTLNESYAASKGLLNAHLMSPLDDNMLEIRQCPNCQHLFIPASWSHMINAKCLFSFSHYICM